MFACLLGCSQTEVQTVAELNEFLSDPANSLIQSAEINDVNITVIYKPTDLLVYREVGDFPTDSSVVARTSEKYSNYYYFILSISKNQNEVLVPRGDILQFSSLVQTLSFRMNDYVNLTTSERDTIPVADFIYNRTYGFSHATELLFVFSKDQCEGKEWVDFNLKELGMGLGNQHFRFNLSDLDRVPKLRFNIRKS